MLCHRSCVAVAEGARGEAREEEPKVDPVGDW